MIYRRFTTFIVLLQCARFEFSKFFNLDSEYATFKGWVSPTLSVFFSVHSDISDRRPLNSQNRNKARSSSGAWTNEFSKTTTARAAGRRSTVCCRLYGLRVVRLLTVDGIRRSALSTTHNGEHFYAQPLRRDGCTTTLDDIDTEKQRPFSTKFLIEKGGFCLALRPQSTNPIDVDCEKILCGKHRCLNVSELPTTRRFMCNECG